MRCDICRDKPCVHWPYPIIKDTIYDSQGRLIGILFVDLKTDDKTEETREAGLREAISATLRQAIKSSDKPESSNG